MTWVEEEVQWTMNMTTWAEKGPWAEMDRWAEEVLEGSVAGIGMAQWEEEEGEGCLTEAE